MAKFSATMKKVFVDGIWNTFCVKWIWETFFVAWIHDAFFINFVCKKLKFDKWKAWVYLSPAIILLLIFTAWPILNTLRMAFIEDFKAQNYRGLFEIDWSKLGFKNFEKVVEYRAFKTALKNTMLLCFLTVPISTFLALLIAVCLNAIKPFQRLLQTIFFLPYVTNSIAIGMVFAAMFNVVGRVEDPNAIVGIVNNILKLFGVEPIDWINSSSSYGANLTVLVIYIVWNALPFKILVLLGGLQSVNKQYYEAAKIDGTPRWRVFTKITVPLLSPMIAYVVITGFIGGFKEYSSIIGIFGDGMAPPGTSLPGNKRWYTMVGYIYDNIERNQGRASAAALILFAIIFAVTMVNLYVSKKKTHY
ncbi:MAG: sugar ABC transporter permease [Clostridiales bacterium]|nr:sugar ABC transporter permease [Clostridiales bacterium]